MKPPETLRQLADWLRLHPRVRGECPHPKVPDDPEMTFRGAHSGGLWFDLPGGGERYLPIDCGMTAAETGVTFRPDGFDVTKFGITICYTYLPEKEEDPCP